MINSLTDQSLLSISLIVTRIFVSKLFIQWKTSFLNVEDLIKGYIRLVVNTFNRKLWLNYRHLSKVAKDRVFKKIVKR